MTSFYSTLLVAKFADVLITCDTSVAHLAGISGVPCLLLLGPNMISVGALIIYTSLSKCQDFKKKWGMQLEAFRKF